MNKASPRMTRKSRLSLTLVAIVGALACWAALNAAGGASAAVSSGGGLNLTAATEESKPPKSGRATRFGTRVLREGMTGPDVKVLKGIVRAESLLVGTAVTGNFDSPTTKAVRKFQRRTSISSNGVVNRKTARKLVGSMGRAGASWYGPGFYGNKTACGQTLKRGTVGVAHKTLPCGSKVLIGFRGRYLMTRVIDRGPFIAGRSWDLTNAARKALKFDGVETVRHAVIKRK